MQNLNYLFNKEYYKDLGNPNCELTVRSVNKVFETTQFRLTDYLSLFSENIDFFKRSFMEVCSPGLIICMGNPHGMGTNDFNLNISDFLTDDKYDLALKYIVNDVMALRWQENEIDGEITNEQIATVKGCLLRNHAKFVRFYKRGNRSVVFNDKGQLEKLRKKIKDYCINSNSEIKNGFSFDYTSGQPYIPGSSVKGILRSIFKEHPEAVMEILKDVSGIDLTKDEVAVLENDIFDNNDVFLDAVIYWGDKYGNILSTDFITPHKSPIKNPIPIRILKINPGVKLEFRFILHDHAVSDKVLTGNDLNKVFTVMLSLFGVGAKTNVGYGILKESDKTRSNYSVRNPSQGSQQTQMYSVTEQKSNSSAGTAATPEKIICPHCGKLTYKYASDGKTLNTNCKNPECKKPLNPEGVL